MSRWGGLDRILECGCPALFWRGHVQARPSVTFTIAKDTRSSADALGKYLITYGIIGTDRLVPLRNCLKFDQMSICWEYNCRWNFWILKDMIPMPKVCFWTQFLVLIDPIRLVEGLVTDVFILSCVRRPDHVPYKKWTDCLSMLVEVSIGGIVKAGTWPQLNINLCSTSLTDLVYSKFNRQKMLMAEDL